MSYYYMQIETVLSDNQVFNFEIKTNALYDIQCLPSTKHIESLDAICQICITNNIILTLCEDRDLRNSPSAPDVKDKLEVNTINAYDWNGNHLWNIADLVGDIKMSFLSIGHISPLEAKSRFGLDLHENLSYIYECIAGGFTFIIDAYKRELLLKIAGKVR